ncbi:MAG: hypothetical protein WB988_23500 [Candidatus Nitrosopolaris sp.]
MREVRDRFTKGANNDKILILSISPLVLAWRAIYAGGAITYSNDGGSGSGTSRVDGTADEFGIDGTAGIDAATDKTAATGFSPFIEERARHAMYQR